VDIAWLLSLHGQLLAADDEPELARQKFEQSLAKLADVARSFALV